ncbi:CmcI family methyltransferase [Mumia zhuanghuii]|uniref:CmcI family methyltransferase n=1 Tax=Mumia zhuanghuii TaxID=2585211 RepID=UPI003639B8F2
MPRSPVQRVRARLVRRIDDLALGRAQTLIARSERGEAADALVTMALRSTAARARKGALTPKEQKAVAAAFSALWSPQSQPVDPPPAIVGDVIRNQFHLLYYHVSRQTWKDTWYRGIATYKCPTDMWVYQELIDELRPGLVVETGTFRGGSALFLADRLETLGHGEVVSVDIDPHGDERPTHPRLTYLIGSSVAPDIVNEIRQRIPTDGSPVLVILDSDHSQQHVAAELHTYAPLVTVGSYLIVEDTNVNGHPAAPDHGPGPYEAVAEFLAEDRRYAVDPRCERYFLTQNPSGYLRRER